MILVIEIRQVNLQRIRLEEEGDMYSRSQDLGPYLCR